MPERAADKALVRRLDRNERARRFGAALAERRTAMSQDDINEERSLVAGSAAYHTSFDVGIPLGPLDPSRQLGQVNTSPHHA